MDDKVSQKLIGARVRAARESADITQDTLAASLQLKDRQSISDIENGKRTLRADELMFLTEIFKRDIDYFLNPFAVAGEAQFSWRAATDLSASHLESFELRAGKWIGLLRWLRNQKKGRSSVLKQALRISSTSSFEDAQQCAQSLVEELNLGDIPAKHLADKVEKVLDIPVLFVDPAIDRNNKGELAISGATCHLEDFTAILINRYESEARRNFNLAHELFHALTWDAMRPEHRESNEIESRNSKKRRRIEQLADNFASALLMPKASLEKYVDCDRALEGAYLRDMAAKFYVSPNALGWRLFNLKLIEQFNGLDWSMEDLDPKAVTTTPKSFSKEFAVMLHDAIDSGKLSARKATKTMDVNVFELMGEHELSSPIEDSTLLAA